MSTPHLVKMDLVRKDYRKKKKCQPSTTFCILIMYSFIYLPFSCNLCLYFQRFQILENKEKQNDIHKTGQTGLKRNSTLARIRTYNPQLTSDCAHIGSVVSWLCALKSRPLPALPLLHKSKFNHQQYPTSQNQLSKIRKKSKSTINNSENGK